MRADPDIITGADVTLLPVTGGTVEHVLAHDLRGRPPGRGWPTPDTAFALGFVAGGGLTWLVVDEHGTVAGELGTKAAPDPSGTVEIGYGLAAPSRGRGLGSRAVAALLGFLQQRPDVVTVIAHVAVGNEPSRRLLERLAFRPDGDPEAGEMRYLRILR